MSQQTVIRKMRKKSCCQQTCYFCHISQSKTDHKSMKHSKRKVQNKSLQKHMFLIGVQIHKICLSKMTQFFLNVPSFLKTKRCSTDVYRGSPKQPDKPERSKGLDQCYSLQNSQKGKELCKCPAYGEMHSLGQENRSSSSQLLVAAKKQDCYNYALAGVNPDNACIAEIVTKSQVLLVISNTFSLKMKQVTPLTIFFLRRTYCILSS